jgi:LysM repeat protein
LSLFLLLVLLLAGCRPTRPAKTPTPTSALPPPLESASAVAPGPRPSDTQAPGQAETEAPDGTAIALASPSPTGCPRPEGWVIYTIQPGDTLQNLAERTGTTVDELMRLNCLSSPLIIAYEQLYLPRRPAAPGAVLPPPAPVQPPGGGGQPPPVVVDCNETLTCVLPGAPLVVVPGDPGNPDPNAYTPCEADKDKPWIDVHGGVLHLFEQGMRTYFYACDYDTGGGVIAEAIPLDDNGAPLPGEPIPLTAYAKHPVGSIQNIGRATAVIDFPVSPDKFPPGIYRVQISVGDVEAEVPVTLQVVSTSVDRHYILPVPVTGSPGDKIDIYYINFPLNTIITAVLYSAEPPFVGEITEAIKMPPRLTWLVSIGKPLAVAGPPPAEPAGWEMMPYTFPTAAVTNAYAVANEATRARSMIWIK